MEKLEDRVWIMDSTFILRALMNDLWANSIVQIFGSQENTRIDIPQGIVGEVLKKHKTSGITNEAEISLPFEFPFDIDLEEYGEFLFSQLSKEYEVKDVELDQRISEELDEYPLHIGLRKKNRNSLRLVGKKLLQHAFDLIESGVHVSLATANDALVSKFREHYLQLEGDFSYQVYHPFSRENLAYQYIFDTIQPLIITEEAQKDFQNLELDPKRNLLARLCVLRSTRISEDIKADLVYAVLRSDSDLLKQSSGFSLDSVLHSTSNYKRFPPIDVKLAAITPESVIWDQDAIFDAKTMRNAKPLPLDYVLKATRILNKSIMNQKDQKRVAESFNKSLKETRVYEERSLFIPNSMLPNQTQRKVYTKRKELGLGARHF